MVPSFQRGMLLISHWRKPNDRLCYVYMKCAQMQQVGIGVITRGHFMAHADHGTELEHAAS